MVSGFSYSPSSNTEGTSLPDNDPLGPGEPNPGCRVGEDYVQPPPETVWQHRGVTTGLAEDLHHQPGLRERHHQPAGCPGPDSVPPQCQDGQGRGASHDQRAGVGHSQQVQFSRDFSLLVAVHPCCMSYLCDRRRQTACCAGWKSITKRNEQDS